MKLHTNIRGFAHPVLLVVALVGIFALIGVAGQRVWTKRNDAKQQEVASSVPDPILITSSGDASGGGSESKPTKISVNRTGSAAAEASQQPVGNASGESLPETKQLETKYDVQTPIGSLSQMILDAKAKRFSNVLYFITPRLMFRAYDMVKAQDINSFAQSCLSNANCKTLMITDVAIDKSHILERDCRDGEYSDLSGVECKKLQTTVAVKDGKLITEYYKTVGYGHYKVSLYMLHYDGQPNWVLDKVEVDNFTL